MRKPARKVFTKDLRKLARYGRLGHMTEEQTGGLVLEFGIADRLRKAREHIGCDQKEFAVLTGISRGTIRNYESTGYQTRKPYILSQWAMATGVSQRWLETGEGSPGTPPGGRRPASDDALAQLASRKRSRHAGSSVKQQYPQAA